MKRFKRIAAGALTAISLLMFLGNVALWARSYSRSDILMHIKTEKPANASSSAPAPPYFSRSIFAAAAIRGRYQIGLTRESYASFSLVPDGWKHASVATALVNTPPARWLTLGFSYSHVVIPAPFVITQNGAPIPGSASMSPIAEAWNVWVPCWFVALVTLIDPVLWFRAAVRRSEKTRGP